MLCIWLSLRHSILLLLLISSVAHTLKGHTQCVCVCVVLGGVALLLFQFCSPTQPYKQNKSPAIQRDTKATTSTENSGLFWCHASVKATLNTRPTKHTHRANDTQATTDLSFWKFQRGKLCYANRWLSSNRSAPNLPREQWMCGGNELGH